MIREVFREHLPLAPCPVQVEDGVDDFTEIESARSARSWRGTKMRFEELPLGIREIGGVTPVTARENHANCSIAADRKAVMQTFYCLALLTARPAVYLLLILDR